MKIFEINENALQKGWGAEDQYWFFVKDYSIVEDIELRHLKRPENIDDEEFLRLNDIIPYFTVNRTELAKAYIETLSNRKLKEKLSSINNSEFIEMFWKYFNVYHDLFEDYEAFERKYILQKAEEWCKENHISYTVSVD